MSTRVLAIDDDSIVRRFLTRFGQKSGMEMVVEASGAAGLARMANESFDLVLCDMQMPIMDGIQVAERVAAEWPELPVIMLTSVYDVPTVVRAMSAGATDYVLKVRQSAEMEFSLHQAIDRAIEKRNLMDRADIFEASRHVFGVLDPSEVAPAIVKVALTAIRSEAATVLVVDEGIIHQQVTIGDMNLLRASVSAIREATLFAARDLAVHRELVASGVCHLIAFPLFSRNHLHGILVLVRSPSCVPFDARDERRTALLAAQMSLALDNARLVITLNARVKELEAARVQSANANRMVGIGHLATRAANRLRDPFHYLQTNLRGLEGYIGRLRVFSTTLSLIDRGGPLHAAWSTIGGSDALLEAEQRLEYATNATQRVGMIIDDLTRVAQTREDLLVELPQLLDAVLAMAGDRVHARINVRVGQDTIQGNPARMAQAVIDALLYADALIPAGSKTPIDVTSRTVNGVMSLFVRVEDIDASGPRTAAERDAMANVDLGTCHQILASHGGRLRVSDGNRPGLEISMELPVIEQEEMEFVC